MFFISTITNSELYSKDRYTIKCIHIDLNYCEKKPNEFQTSQNKIQKSLVDISGKGISFQICKKIHMLPKNASSDIQQAIKTYLLNNYKKLTCNQITNKYVAFKIEGRKGIYKQYSYNIYCKTFDKKPRKDRLFNPYFIFNIFIYDGLYYVHLEKDSEKLLSNVKSSPILLCNSDYKRGLGHVLG